jgi:hypothetical protein
MNIRFAVTCFLLVGMCVVAASAQQRVQRPSPSAPSPSTALAPVIPQKPAPPGTLPPLPRVSFTPSMPMAIIQGVYEFAARHPEVLQYVPCYCGCEREGHRGNHECFVKSRAASGRIVEWDSHGIGCDVCLHVGMRAMQLFNEGKTVTQIRATIDREIGSRFPSSTPTPQPPKAKTRS